MKKLLQWTVAWRLPDQIRALLAFEIAFYCAYRYGMSFSSAHPAPFWLPDAVILCALLVSPRKWWWMYLVAQIPIRFFVAVPAATPFWFLLLNLLNDYLKSLLSALMLSRGTHVGKWFDDLRGFTKYVLIAVLLSPGLSAIIGALARGVFGAKFGSAWFQWFLGDALAALLLTPALFCFVREFQIAGRRSLARNVEGVLMALGIAAVAYLEFAFVASSNNPLFLVFLPIPFLLWAAVRFGPFSTCVVLTVMSTLTVFGAAAGRGPFALLPSASSILSIQLFLFVLSVPFLFLSVLMNQHRWTESALRESEERFRTLVDTAPVLVWMSDAEGRCTFFSKPWLDFTDLSIEKQLGNGWSTLVHPEDRNRCVEETLESVYRQTSFSLEYRLLRHDGVYRWVLGNGVPRYGPAGNFLGHIGSCVDITERKGAEEALRRLPRELMNAQEAERQRIAQELHDDLGQRLVALGMGINHLSRTNGHDLKLKTGFAELNQQATEIINDIASLSHELRPVTLRVLGLAAALQSLCDEVKDPDGVNVVFTQQGQLPEMPGTAAIGLYRVAQEAIRNAMAHSGSKQVEVAMAISRSTLNLTVTDKGCGFAVNHEKARLGLGLTGMVERMNSVGGTLSIDSTLTVGTTITASVALSELAQPAATSV